MIEPKYYIITVMAAGLAIFMGFLPDQSRNRERNPEQMLADINYDTRFWSTDRVAKTMIQEDPLLMLIDVRTPEEYAKFHLPGAINAPLNDITSEDWVGYFDQDVKEVVLYSNGTIYANQAWMLLRRLNYSNLSVMRGGLNRWVETILRPTPPHRSASANKHNLYQQRLGASMFFGGGGTSTKNKVKANTAPPTIKKRKKKAVEGGC